MGIGPSRVQTPDRQGVGRTASKLPSPNPSTGIESSGPSNPATARGGLSYNDTGFYGHSQPRPSRGIDEIPSFSLSDTDTTSQEPPIWKTPSVSLSKVLVELYAQQLFPLIPVMDSHDLNGADVAPIVQQAVYLGGSMMRRAKDYPGNLKPKDFFVRIKRLLFLDDQPDAFAVLKSLCILSCWSYKSPTLATLDSPWQWSGMAMRLAMQLGLHKEATYTHLESRKSARRVWWFLFVSSNRAIY